MRGRTLVLPLALAIAALPGAGRRADAQQIAYAAGVSLDSATRAALNRELSHAEARGLPVEPLEAKVREGQIKRAAPARIRTAVAALAVRLDSARSALGTGSTAAELVAGADALGAGADPAALRTLRVTGKGRDLSSPLGALAQLVASGVAPRRATQMIVELLKRDATPRELLAFGIAVESDVGAGVPAEESAVFRLRSIEASGLGGDRVTATFGQQTGGAVSTPSAGDAGRPKRRP